MLQSTMTKRERLLAATRCQPVDEVPISTGYLGEWQDGWRSSDPSYRELLQLCRTYACGTYFYEPVPAHLRGTEMEASYSSDPVFCPFVYSYTAAQLPVERTEVREQGNRIIRTTIHTSKGPLTNEVLEKTGIRTRWQTEHFVKTDEDLERFFSIPVEPVVFDCSAFEAADRRIGDQGLVSVVVPDALYCAADLFHFEEFTLRAFQEPELFRKLMDCFHQPVLNRVQQMIDQGVGQLFRIVGPEYATPPFLSPELFHNYVTEYDRDIVEIIHRAGHLARLHSHGRVRSVLPEIMQMHVDATDPLEAPPDGDITIREARSILKNQVAIWGNLELKDLEHLSCNDIDAMVTRVMAEGKEDDGFVIMPTAEPITQPLSVETVKKYAQYLQTAKREARY